MVGLAVWKEAGCRNERTVPLNLSNLNIPRRTAQRAGVAFDSEPLTRGSGAISRGCVIFGSAGGTGIINYTTGAYSRNLN